MTKKDIQDKIDTRINTLIASLGAKQKAYLASKGRFWQGVETHQIRPKDGAASKPDLKVKPTDQVESWEDFGINLPNVEASIKVDVYDGPAGMGYVVTAFVEIAGELWSRSINVGPETYRERAWQVTSPPMQGGLQVSS